MGTGLKECIVSGLLSVDGLKVLHMDRNDYYGAASASLNLTQFFERFGKGAAPPAELGSSRDYNIDLMPKFIMASGLLVKMLVHTDVTKYLDFKLVEGSYVFKGGKVHKVPATDKEALATPLVGFFEKKRLRDFILFVQDFDEKDPSSWKGFDGNKNTANQLFEKYSLSDGTKDFIGHALALFRDDDYLTKPAIELINRVRLYGESLARYTKSPYLYPLYGLGELPQAFARLSAVYGGTFMLNRPVDEVVYDAEGRAVGVKSQGEAATCKFVVADPSYFPTKVHATQKIVRAIAILSHPITPGNETSAQIILPQNQVDRKNDIYVFLCSFNHCVAANGKYVAFVSTTKERARPEEDLAEGVKLLGKVDYIVYDEYDLMEPVADGQSDRVFISKAYDPTSHFETTSQDVMDLYKRITGKDLDLSKSVVEHAADEE